MSDDTPNTLIDEKQARSFVAELCDAAAMERLERFCAILLEENARQNLISKGSVDSLWLRHIADSAQLLSHVPRETFEQQSNSDPWLDLGTGAGFPGVVIAALRPKWPVRLVESRIRRVEFLQRAIVDLELLHCTVLGDRLERIEPFCASVISARAFAPLEKLLRLSAPFSTKATRYILPKGRSAAQELSGQKKPIRTKFHVKHSLTDPEAGIIVSA
ncbi:MAG: 16S rRNA (guanine(527)-N(7))-methyltransferase RsmG [Pseudomonadota bacterium]